MPSFYDIPSTDVDAKSPVSDALMGNVEMDLDVLLSILTARGGVTIVTASGAGSYVAVTTKQKITLLGGGGAGGTIAGGPGIRGVGSDGENSWFGNSGQFAKGGKGGLDDGLAESTVLAPSVGSNYTKSGSRGATTYGKGIEGAGDGAGPTTLFPFEYLGALVSGAGTTAPANSGGGGGASWMGGVSYVIGIPKPTGGQPGEEAIYYLVSTPGASLSYYLGYGGLTFAGRTGPNTSGNGGSGLIIIEEMG